MKKNLLRAAIVAIALLGLMAVGIVGTLIYRGPVHLMRVNQYWGQVTGIRFYGLVVDQSGNPIPNAKVSVLIDNFNYRSILTGDDYLRDDRIDVTTGPDGRFTIKTRGMSVRIDSVTHESYADNPRSGWYRRGDFSDNWFYYYSSTYPGHVPYKPNPTRPAIFPLAKPGQPATSQPSRGGTAQ